MSFGQRKMFAKCDELAPSVLVSDHRGMEWIVITPAGFYFGTAAVNGPGNETFKDLISRVDDHFKPWAKKLLRNYNDLQAQKELAAQPASAAKLKELEKWT